MANYWLDEKAKTLPFSEECDKFKVQRRTAEAFLIATASACNVMQQRDCKSMARQLVDSIIRRGGRAISWTEAVRYDETPMTMRLTDTEKRDLEKQQP
eukprot:2029074-Pyramimonas_sp.AAC.1